MSVSYVRAKMFLLLPLLHVWLLYYLCTSSVWYVVLAVGLLMYFPIQRLGQSIGYHKLFAHRAFEPVWWYPYVATFFALISFHGDPLSSTFVHRLHHKFSDQERDPHSPSKGRWHAYIGWVWNAKQNATSREDLFMMRDILKNYPWMQKVPKWEAPVVVSFYALLYVISPVLFFTILTACLLSLHSSLFISAFSHNEVDGKWDYTDNVLLARLVNSSFLNKDHHLYPNKWDNTAYGVQDFSAWIIKKYLKKPVAQQ